MAGRPKGAKSSKTLANEASIAALAKTYAPVALKVLNDIALAGESEAARVSAANAILDRAYGKAPQAVMVEGNEDKPIKMEISWSK